MPLLVSQPADRMSNTVMDGRTVGHGVLDFQQNDFMTSSSDISTTAGYGIGPEVRRLVLAALCEAHCSAMIESICRARV